VWEGFGVGVEDLEVFELQFSKAGGSVLKGISESEMRLISSLVVGELGEVRYGVTQEVEPGWEVRSVRAGFVCGGYGDADTTAMF
jgi:hypothetical protein